jgi:hypothetical protein
MQRQGTMLPMRFGTLVADDAKMRDRLRRDQTRYCATLAGLAGRSEVNVKLRGDEDVLIAAVADQPRVRRLRGASAYHDQIALGETVAAAIDAALRDDAHRLYEALSPLAIRTADGPPVPGCASNVSYLVATDRLAEFTARAAAVEHKLADRAHIQCTGPLPPYSFIGEAT